MALQPHGVQNRANIPTPLTAESTRTLHSDWVHQGQGLSTSLHIYIQNYFFFLLCIMPIFDGHEPQIL
jgi:hypothetical protein